MGLNFVLKGRHPSSLVFYFIEVRGEELGSKRPQA